MQQRKRTSTPASPPPVRNKPTYDRARDLPRLLALWPHEVGADGIEATTLLVEKIRAALRRERVRGQGGHWCYDLNRHRALLACYRAEVRRLAELRHADRDASAALLTPRPPGRDRSALPARPETHLLGEL